MSYSAPHRRCALCRRAAPGRDGRELLESIFVDPPSLVVRTALAGVEKRVLVVRGLKSLEAGRSASAIPRESARLRCA